MAPPGFSVCHYCVASDEGPHRKYYGLNEVGRSMYASSAKTWTSFAAIMASLLKEGHA